MATKKKASNIDNKKEKELKNLVESLEERIKQFEDTEKIENKIKEKKNKIRKDLASQLTTQKKYGKQFDDMIEDYLYLFGLKERLQIDINNNGLRYKTTGGNGFTSYKPNESCERLLKVNGQMLKILQDLELKAPELSDSGDDKDDLC